MDLCGTFKNGGNECPGQVIIGASNRIEQSIKHNHPPAGHSHADEETFSTNKDKLSAENIKQWEEREQIYHDDGFTYKHNHNDLYYACVDAECGARAIIAKGLIEVTIQHNHKGEQMMMGNFIFLYYF